ncbi:MAG: MCE family protein [Lentimicrobiaceae bacterium]|nr:MCE family protein [Lentimicrobiaceae bacterium]
MKRSKEIRIAAVFLAALALIIWGVNFLKGSDLFYRQRTFYAVYDRIDGLVPSNPVSINGFRVGQVKDIRFLDDGSYRILVEFSLSDPVPVPSNSVAVVFSSDLMGSKEISIRLGDAPTLLNSGDTISSEIQASLQEEVNRQVAPLKKKAEDLMLSLDSIFTVVRLVLNEETRAGLQSSINNIRLTIDGLRHTAANIDTLVSDQRNRLEMIIANVESITRNLKANNEAISQTLQNIHQLSDEVAASDVKTTLANMNKVTGDLAFVTRQIQEGKGSLGLLLNNDTLYRQLESSARDLDLLLEDMRLNPQRYVHFSVFGRKVKPYEPPQEGITTKEPR